METRATWDLHVWDMVIPGHIEPICRVLPLPVMAQRTPGRMEPCMHACTLPDMSVHGAGLHGAHLQGVNPFIAGRLFLACTFQLNAQAVRANLIALAALVTRTLVHGRSVRCRRSAGRGFYTVSPTIFLLLRDVEVAELALSVARFTELEERPFWLLLFAEQVHVLTGSIQSRLLTNRKYAGLAGLGSGFEGRGRGLRV